MPLRIALLTRFAVPIDRDRRAGRSTHLYPVVGAAIVVGDVPVCGRAARDRFAALHILVVGRTVATSCVATGQRRSDRTTGSDSGVKTRAQREARDTCGAGDDSRLSRTTDGRREVQGVEMRPTMLKSRCCSNHYTLCDLAEFKHRLTPPLVPDVCASAWSRRSTNCRPRSQEA